MNYMDLKITRNRVESRSGRCSFLFVPLLFVVLLHMPIVFAKSPAHANPETEPQMKSESVDETLLISTRFEENQVDSIYDMLQLEKMGLKRIIFQHALKGFSFLQQKGKFAKDNIISIADFSQPSTKKRLFVIDLDQNCVLFNTYVAHGVNSGKVFANQFSNKPASYMSSLGFYETTNTYLGGNGYSLRLNGLEKGINDNANRRDIVIHGADYANETLVKAQGYLGRSWGCPALPEKLSKPIIDEIKNGSCFFIYSQQKSYLQKSRVINA